CKTDTPLGGLHIQNLPTDLKPRLRPYSSGYVLRTGAGWHGNIGKATIRIHYGEVKKRGMLRMQPEQGWKYDTKRDQDVLVLTDFKPDPGELSRSDVQYEFRLVTDEQEAQLLLGAIRKKQLDPWGMERLLKLIEEQNAPKLSATERQRQAFEVLELMVPPKGPRFRQLASFEEEDPKAIPRGAEFVLRRAYTRLLNHYTEQKNTEDAVKVAREFVPFLKVILDREGGWFKDPAKQVGSQWEEHREMMQQYESLKNWLKKSGD
ncbi:MAG TPA: hypothetical protein VKE74_12415, partial [Gemmataceae bacterium]|nr:hypothetical protein [Gemmataceae bacterium]